MDFFVINLARRRDRLDSFLDRFPGTGSGRRLRIFEAVDGQNLRGTGGATYEAFMTRLQERGVEVRLIKGELGCLLSHMSLWQRIIDENLVAAHIFEDDAQFVEDYIARLQQLNVPDDAMVVYTGGRDTPYFEGVYTTVAANETVVVHDKEDWGRKKSDLDRWLHSYVVTKAGAAFLLDYLFEQWQGKNAVDHAVLVALRDSTHPTYDMKPHVCFSVVQGDSDIRNWHSKGQRFCPVDWTRK